MIKIFLLGQISVTGKGGRSADLYTRRGTELFTFLVLESGRTFHRARLAEQFWGHLPEKRGRKALNTELWRITAALRAIGMDVATSLVRTQHEVGYTRQPDHEVDVDHLNQAADIVAAEDPEAVSAADLERIERAVEAYRGDLLESVYSDWCLLWRESLRANYTEALEFLLHAAMGRQDWASGLRHGRALLALDPLLEHVHRALMRCHYHAGNRPLALRQYAHCEQILREELGVAPMDETRRIQETLLAVTPRPSRAVEQRVVEAPPRQDGTRRSPAQKVDLALSNINTARGWLEDVSQQLRGGPSKPA
ncbi:AfsR/SARP family transcriptional regulator [Ruegeria hyattellae]|uniref:AfsR/SARP family transcriptional regulator n=1 Tax=Ruegeria hyattellae TaxID=3233337 RepID=UPI00355B2FFB